MSTNKFFKYLLILSLSLNLSVSALEGKDDAGNAAVINGEVLIAIQKSQFKEKVALKIRNLLREDGHHVKIISLKELSAESASDYRAVVVLNTCWAWRVNSHVRKFLDKTPESEKRKVILFTTANSRNWQPKVSGVEAITSASVMSEAGRIAYNIISSVRILLRQ